VIRCGFFGDPLNPVRFRPIVFVEEQKGDDRAAIRDALFFAASAADRAAIAAARARGQVVRAWGFSEDDRTPSPAAPVENMPATDTPSAEWYTEYLETNDAVA